MEIEILLIIKVIIAKITNRETVEAVMTHVTSLYSTHQSAVDAKSYPKRQKTVMNKRPKTHSEEGVVSTKDRLIQR